MVDAGSFKNGITIQYENGIWQVIEFQHVKPGKGSPFVRAKLKNIISGGVIENSSDQLRSLILHTSTDQNISIYMLMEIFTTL